MNTVHLRINVDNKPSPVRLRIVDGQGVERIPFGRLADFPTGEGEEVGGNVLLDGIRYSYLDGACEVRLPAGEITVEAHKGPEFVPLRQRVTLGPGQISLRLALECWADLAAEGWYAGDVRAHEIPPHAAALEGAAEGLSVVHLLARARPGAMPNLLAFSGTTPAVESIGCAVAVNTLNVHPVLGSVALLNCHRPVFPLRFGGPEGEDDWSVIDWCEQCHRKKGLVVWPDLGRLDEHAPQGEALAAALLGQVDAFELGPFSGADHPSLPLWYRLLDVGRRLPLVGASGKGSNRVALGCLRTYARLPAGEPFSLAGWVEAVRAGRTFVTGGPLLSLAVEGRDGSVRFRAAARSATPFDRLEVVCNGEVIADAAPAGERQEVVVEGEHRLAGRSWLAARCRGRGMAGFAHTSAVFFHTDDRRPAGDEAVAPLREALGRTARWVEGEARCPSARHREQLAEVLRRAEGALSGREEG
jgi:hypothetical protein